MLINGKTYGWKHSKGRKSWKLLLGMPEEDLLKELAQPFGIENRHSGTVYEAEHVSFFVDDKTKK